MEIKNQQIISEDNPKRIYEYPRWSADEKFVIYDSNKSGRYQMYVYNLEDRTTVRLSSKEKNNYQFGNFQNLPK